MVCIGICQHAWTIAICQVLLDAGSSLSWVPMNSARHALDIFNATFRFGLPVCKGSSDPVRPHAIQQFALLLVQRQLQPAHDPLENMYAVVGTMAAGKKVALPW